MSIFAPHNKPEGVYQTSKVTLRDYPAPGAKVSKTSNLSSSSS